MARRVINIQLFSLFFYVFAVPPLFKWFTLFLFARSLLLVRGRELAESHFEIPSAYLAVLGKPLTCLQSERKRERASERANCLQSACRCILCGARRNTASQRCAYLTIHLLNSFFLHAKVAHTHTHIHVHQSS